MKKILYIHHTFRDQSYNCLLWNIAQRIDKKKYEIFACCLREGGPYEKKLSDIGVKVKNFTLKSIFDLRIIPRLITYIKKNNIDIVHTAVFPADVYGRISAKLAKVPNIISTMHRVEDHKQEKKYRLFSYADTLTMALTTKIIAVSEGVKNYLIRWHKLQPTKVTTIYNGIDVNQYRSSIDIEEYKERLNLRSDIPIVAFIGRLVKVKGLEYFLKAATEVLGSGEKAQFLIVGDGPLKEKLVNQSRKLGIDKHVNLTGHRNDIPQILAVVDILILPSLWEGLPLCILEAMAAGKPIIATKVGGAPEIVEDRKTGILVPSRDPKALAEAIAELLRSSKKRKEMGKEGRKRVLRNFGIDKMISEYEKLYDACAARPTS